MRPDYVEVFQATEVAQRYATVVYAPGSYWSAVNLRHRRYLRALVRHHFPYRRPVQHDFACGTGRAIQLLQGLVRAAHGYDTSTQMLAQARAGRVYATLHHVASDGPVPSPADDGRPIIVTVLRLLLNAPDHVRQRAIAFAAAALPDADSGLLVVENHGNRSSLRGLVRGRRTGRIWFDELSDTSVVELLDRYGFTVVERKGCALLPARVHRYRWLRPVLVRVDDLLCGVPWLTRFATDVLYVARRRVDT